MQFKSIGATLGTVAVASVLLAGNAAAQTNVTVYGIVDAGPEIINNAGANGNMLERISSGNLSGSRLGFKGTEDLGGGLQAVFALENGMDVSTGTALQSGRLFGRQAFVGLQGSWGSLLLGRQNSLQLDWMSKYNTMDNATWSSKVLDASFSDRIDNAVKYTVKVAAPVEISTYYSTGYDTATAANGEQPGSKAGREMGIGSQYNDGAMKFAAVFDQKNGLGVALANNIDRHLTLGARFKASQSFEVMGGYLFDKIENVGTPEVRKDMYWIGASYQITGPLQISASYYHLNVKNSAKDPTDLITLVKYSLSKRTDLYLINSYVMNRGGSNFGVNGDGSSITPGSNQFGTMLGVRHTF